MPIPPLPPYAAARTGTRLCGLLAEAENVELIYSRQLECDYGFTLERFKNPEGSIHREGRILFC